MAEVLAFRDAIAASDPVLHEALVTAIDVCVKTLHVFGSRPNGVVFSFNGGKDSTVALHVLRAALHMMKTAPSNSLSPSTPSSFEPLSGVIPVVYFEAPNNFPEVLDFMAQCEKEYGFKTRHLDGFKGGLTALIGEGMQAVVMGTRSTDPDGVGLEHFSPTSLNWPPAMRVCPVLHWRYDQVWAFLRGIKLPYCCLYDRGYTSLGSVRDSVPNPLLRKQQQQQQQVAEEKQQEGGESNGNGNGFLPAWMLTDGEYERLGRTKKVVATTAAAASTMGGAAAVAASPASSAAAAAATSGPDAVARAEVEIKAEEIVRRVRSASTGGGAGDAAGGSHHPEVIPTAAIVVIGDEVLSGRVKDANGSFLCSELAAKGILVSEVAIVADDPETISHTVRRLAPLHTYVLACGGLGPTHDDTTMKGIGQAFSYKLARCRAFENFLVALEEDRQNKKRTATTASGAAAGAAGEEAIADSSSLQRSLRMADLPFGADVTLFYPDGTCKPAFPQVEAAAGGSLSSGEKAEVLAKGYPLLRVKNVFVFPGVPFILRAKWKAHHAQLFQGLPSSSAAIRVEAEEARLVALMEEFAAGATSKGGASGPLLRIGSYPPAEEDEATEAGGTTEAAAAASKRRGPSTVIVVSAIGTGSQTKVESLKGEIAASLEKQGLSFSLLAR